MPSVVGCFSAERPGPRAHAISCWLLLNRVAGTQTSCHQLLTASQQRGRDPELMPSVVGCFSCWLLLNREAGTQSSCHQLLSASQQRGRDPELIPSVVGCFSAERPGPRAQTISFWLLLSRGRDPELMPSVVGCFSAERPGPRARAISCWLLLSREAKTQSPQLTASQQLGRDSISGYLIWNSWRTEWHWIRVSSEILRFCRTSDHNTIAPYSFIIALCSVW
jgi:hypothetical protein